MARPRNPIPKLCIDKTRNRAFCKVNGRFVTLGPAGSSEAQARYAEVLAQLARGQAIEPAKPEPTGISLSELFLRFRTDEIGRFSAAEQRCLKIAIRAARELYGHVPVAEFGPVKLRQVRESMLAKGWSASFVNKQIKRLRLVLRWGVSWELLPSAIVDALATVKALPANQRHRVAVPADRLEAMMACLSERHRDVAVLLLMTGARPSEVLGLRTCDIDRKTEIWRAELSSHKTAHKGKARTLFFNATAQQILLKYFKADQEAKLFRMDADSLRDAFIRASEKAFGAPKEFRARKLPVELRAAAAEWRKEHAIIPYALRHTVATRLVDEIGIESAQRLLGHSGQAMTQHYSRAAEAQAIQAARQLDR